MNQSFTHKVYEIVKQIPKGNIATYQDIARMAGNEKASRAVGSAMKHNPDMKIIPCHRVAGSDGKMHGYAFGNGIPRKMALLQEEGVAFVDMKVDIMKYRWEKVKV